MFVKVNIYPIEALGMMFHRKADPL